MLAEAAEADATDDALYGAEKTGRELPAELQRRQTWLEKLRQARKPSTGSDRRRRSAGSCRGERRGWSG